MTPELTNQHWLETYKSLITLAVGGFKFSALANGGAAVALLAYSRKTLIKSRIEDSRSNVSELGDRQGGRSPLVQSFLGNVAGGGAATPVTSLTHCVARVVSQSHSHRHMSGHPDRHYTRTARRGAGLACAAIALLIAHDSGHAAEVAGVRLDPHVRIGGVELPLNGAGLRRMFLTDVYVIGLYFAGRAGTADDAIQSPGPKRIALTFLRDVTAQELVNALHEGARDSSSEAEFAEIKPAVEVLSATMLPLRMAKKGDSVALDYLPGTGAQVVVNRQPVGTPIASPALYRALMRIWLGSPPVDERLKRALLSGK